MNLQKLKQATRAEHESTEALMPLMDTGLTLEAYGRTLVAMSAVVMAWDAFAQAESPVELRALAAARRRSEMLAEDLAALGLEAAAEDVDLGFARASNAAFLGAMYVVEGSALGGQYIARHVEQALGLTPGRGDAFFRGYGAETGGKWQEFQAVLARVPEADAPAVVDAAKRMFAVFGDALRA